MKTEEVNTEDQRYALAEEAIFGALNQLARKKPIDRITVSDIIRRAGIVRSTFYNHYQDMPSLLEAAEQRMQSEIFDLMRSFRPHGNENICRSYFLALCRYTEGNGFMIQIIRSTDASHFVGESLTALHAYAKFALKVSFSSQSDAASLSSPEKGVSLSPEAKKDAFSYAIAYAIGGVLGILHKWTSDGCIAKPEYVAGLMTESYMRGMAAFICRPD